VLIALMRATRTFAAVGAAVALVVAGALASPASASPKRPTGACASPLGSAPTRVGQISGIVRPMVVHCAQSKIGLSDPAVGTPPLIDHGGPVMAVPSVGNKVVVTPIFWAPSGYSFTSGYKAVVLQYLHDVAAASGSHSNVFATNAEYSGSNGQISYGISVGAAVTDTTAYPTAGCTVNSGAVYADSSGYSTCLDDDQLVAETGAVIAAGSLPTDLGHMYLMFTPKGVESCFYPGNPSNQQCSINSTASAAFCAYHSYFGAGDASIYANMPFPIYGSATGYSCTDENLGGGIQAPNGDVDADVEVSPLSHEMSEAITDPDLDAWYDSSGYENGDECAYVYGPLSGSAGTQYNQVINSHNYLTQTEFSNADYAATGGGCLQSLPAVVPSVTSVSPRSGPTSGGTRVTVTGHGFTAAKSVTFGTKAATKFTVVTDKKITAVAPAHALGTVHITITNPDGTNTLGTTDRFTYKTPKPAVTKISPKSGSHLGGTLVTITGANFKRGATVLFGTARGKHVLVKSATKITVHAPRHSRGTVKVFVTTTGGKSAAKPSVRFRFS